MLYVDEHDGERKVVERPHESDVLEGSSLSRTL